MKSITIVALFLLLGGEIITGFICNGSNLSVSYLLEYGLIYALIAGLPIVFVIGAVRAGPRPNIAYACAWIDIVVGSFIQGGYYLSPDPSGAMMLAISIVTYWVCGFIALIPASTAQP